LSASFRSELSSPGRAISYPWRAIFRGCIMQGRKTAKGSKNRIENRSHHHQWVFVCPPEGGLGSSWLKHASKQRSPTTLIGMDQWGFHCVNRAYIDDDRAGPPSPGAQPALAFCQLFFWRRTQGG
jgi:hypothetical protein